ncbi:hypothetical protein BC940DRAFT_310287 [Gongronella butleri]|nr:hypothetical protein BC940DRAFT_310287 [Gongronella butleri]
MGHTQSKVQQSRQTTTLAWIGFQDDDRAKEQDLCDPERRKKQEGARLLQFPHEYGLELPLTPCRSLTSSPSLSSSSLASTTFFLQQPLSHHPSSVMRMDMDRTDSGYGTLAAALDGDVLAQDIDYVNQLYYAHDKKKLPPPCLPTPLLTLAASSTTSLPPLVSASSSTATLRPAKPTPYSLYDAIGSKNPAIVLDLQLGYHGIVNLCPDLAILTSLRKLELYHNQLQALPEAIGQLEQLEVLDVSQNQLCSLPLSLSNLQRLRELDLSHNRFAQLDCAVLPDSLTVLNVAHNRLVDISPMIIRLQELFLLDLSHNALKVLPAEITCLKVLGRMKLDHCPQLGTQARNAATQQAGYPRRHGAPSLLEICARRVMRDFAAEHSPSPPSHAPRASDVTSDAAISQKTRKRRHQLAQLPTHLLQYLTQAKPCSACSQPYFDTFVQRGRILQKNHHMPIPLEYRLCNAHWHNDNDRLLFLFSQSCQQRLPLHDTIQSIRNLIKSD